MKLRSFQSFTHITWTYKQPVFRDSRSLVYWPFVLVSSGQVSREDPDWFSWYLERDKFGSSYKASNKGIDAVSCFLSFSFLWSDKPRLCLGHILPLVREAFVVTIEVTETEWARQLPLLLLSPKGNLPYP